MHVVNSYVYISLSNIIPLKVKVCTSNFYKPPENIIMFRNQLKDMFILLDWFFERYVFV